MGNRIALVTGAAVARLLAVCLGVVAVGVYGAESEPRSNLVDGDRTATAKAREVTFIDVPRFDDADININLDGVLDENIWSQVPGYDGLTIIVPDIMGVPRYHTDARYLHTEKGLYLGVKLEQPPETRIARLTSRDGVASRDGFTLFLDTSGQGLYGYWFRTNLGGSVRDGKVSPERRFSSEWDGPWQRATAELQNGWSAEIFLPWSMMAMPALEGHRDIGFFFDRHVAHLEERWATPALARTAPRFISAFGTLRFDEVQAERQLAVFPYTSYTYDAIAEDHEPAAGFDLFWRPSTNFQATATFNPDFGAVETDDVVINMTAFETFFPEKRLFFVESNEVFITTPNSRPAGGGPAGGARRTTSIFTPQPVTLLNTRRIGGAPDLDIPDDIEMEGVEQSRPTELLGAAKITGQLGPWRYGLLTAFEDNVRRVGKGENGESVSLEQDGRDFAVVRMLYETSGDGRVSAGYMGTFVKRPREVVEHRPDGDVMVPGFEDDAIVHGIDTHVLSRNGKINWQTQLMASDVDGEQGYGALMSVKYVPNRNWQHGLRFDYLDDQIDISDLGFLQRNDASMAMYTLDYNTSQGLKRLRQRRWQVISGYSVNGQGQAIRGGIFYRNFWTFKNNTEISTELVYRPESWDDRNSRNNGTFRIEERWVGEIGVGTGTNQPLSVSARVGAHQEVLGGWTYRAEGGVTFKPVDRFSLALDFKYYRRDGWLMHQEDRDFTTFKATDWQPRITTDFFINARQQIRLSLQWAGIRAKEQEFWRVPLGDGDLVPRPPGVETDDFTISRLAAQLRYRWEIGPLSDLFIVYTRGSNLDNRIDDDFGDLFVDALGEPVVDVLVLKLRYRFGS